MLILYYDENIIKKLNIYLYTNNHIIIHKMYKLRDWINIDKIDWKYLSENLNVINLIEPSRRDDIESLFYNLLYLLLNNENYKCYDCLNNYEKKNINTITYLMQHTLNIQKINYIYLIFHF